jgi:hypothetical protein
MLFPIVAYPWLSTRLSLEIITGTHRYVNNGEGGILFVGLAEREGEFRPLSPGYLFWPNNFKLALKKTTAIR